MRENQPKKDIIITEKTNENTPTVNDIKNNTNCLSTKRRKIILFTMIGIILLLIIIIIFLFLFKKGSKPKPCIGDECPCIGDDCPCIGDNCPCIGDNCPCIGDKCKEEDPEAIVNINYKKNDILIYNENQSKISIVELNENIPSQNSSDFIQNSIMISKYLINVYDERIEDSSIIYYAYAFVLNMSKKIENKEEVSMGGQDIRYINIDNEEIPVVKFTFNKYGNILSFEINQNMNMTLLSYLFELIERIIPNISKSSFNTRRLNEDSRKFEGNKNKGIIYHDKPLQKNDDNEEKISWETIIEDKKVKKVISFKDFIIKSNNENQINLNLNINNDIDDIKNNENTIIKGLIKQITNKASSIISLHENNNDEKMTNKIFNLIKNITFIIYNNEKENKRIIPKGLLNLRNLLEMRYIDTYAMPISYSYPLFRSNILGIKIGLIANVTFTIFNILSNSSLNSFMSTG